MRWLQIQHNPGSWSNEIRWILRHSKGKNWRHRLIKVAFLETVYEILKHRNNVCFGTADSQLHIAQKIIDVVTYRTWLVPSLRHHVGRLMLH